jgi:hypothetical protein
MKMKSGASVFYKEERKCANEKMRKFAIKVL